MPIQQFPPPLALPHIADAGRIDHLLTTASQAMGDNHPLALAHFRAVLHYCQKSFLRNEKISGDVEKICWQVLGLAIAARHFPMAMAMARHLYIVADNNQKKFDAGCNWLQLLIKLTRPVQAKKLAAHLLLNLLPPDHPQQADWVTIQLADLAMQQHDFPEAIKLLRSLEKNQSRLNQIDLGYYWRINSFSYLHHGDYKNGFRFYEHRGEMADPAFPYFPLNPFHEKGKEWPGQQTDVLLISAEQGLGDAMQFVRFLPAIKHLAKKIILEAQPALQNLLQQSPACDGITITPFGYIPSRTIDHWCFLNSLPWLLQEKIAKPLDKSSDENSMQQFYQPAKPYLTTTAVAPQVIDKRNKKYNIGLVWATSVGGPSGAARTMELTDFLPLLTDKKIADQVNFYSLQIGAAQQHIADCGFGSVIRDLSPYLTDFSITAAVVKELDLVIAVDTAILHLAGGLGRKCFVLIPHQHDWRWGKKMLKEWHGIKNASASYWYPDTHAVFRQEKMGDWHKPVMAIQSCLLDFLSRFS